MALVHPCKNLLLQSYLVPNSRGIFAIPRNGSGILSTLAILSLLLDLVSRNGPLGTSYNCLDVGRVRAGPSNLKLTFDEMFRLSFGMSLDGQVEDSHW